MSYTIGEVASMMGVTPSTLRYYDQEGLLPNVNRVNGIRVFEDKDFAWLRMLNCLKNTNMPIKKIKEYAELIKKGDKSLEARQKIIKEQKELILEQIEQYKYYLKEIEFKEWYYETAIKEGTEKNMMEKIKNNPSFDLDKIPENKRKKRR